MQAVIALGFGAFFVSSLAIGLRLVWLAQRNRGLPELLIGVGILGIGPAGGGRWCTRSRASTTGSHCIAISGVGHRQGHRHRYVHPRALTPTASDIHRPSHPQLTRQCHQQ